MQHSNVLFIHDRRIADTCLKQDVAQHRALPFQIWRVRFSFQADKPLQRCVFSCSAHYRHMLETGPGCCAASSFVISDLVGLFCSFRADAAQQCLVFACAAHGRHMLEIGCWEQAGARHRASPCQIWHFLSLFQIDAALQCVVFS